MKVTRYHHRYQAPALEDMDDPEAIREWRIRRRLRRWGVRHRWRWGFGPTIKDAIRDIMESQRAGAEAVAESIARAPHEGQEAGHVASGIESMGTEVRVAF